MLRASEEEKCNSCDSNLECHFCSTNLCDACAVQIEDNQCCRLCSTSIRNDEYLVAHFIDRHHKASLGNITLSKLPTLLKHEYRLGSTFSVVEFVGKDIMGSVTFRSDAQCDAEAILISTDKPVFNEYRILISKNEIDEFLTSIYANVQVKNT